MKLTVKQTYRALGMKKLGQGVNDVMADMGVKGVKIGSLAMRVVKSKVKSRNNQK